MSEGHKRRLSGKPVYGPSIPESERDENKNSADSPRGVLRNLDIRRPHDLAMQMKNKEKKGKEKENRRQTAQ